MNILEAMDDPALFGADFTGKSWEPWRVLLSSLFALDGPTDPELFTTCTGRDTPQVEPCREAWIVHLDDLGLRRLHARLGGLPTSDQLESCARVAADALGRDEKWRDSEVKRTLGTMRLHQPA